MLQKEHVDLLHKFVDMCKDNPAMLHLPELSFFKNFIESFGGKMPPFSASSKSSNGNTTENEKMTESPQEESEPEPESDLELDNTGVIEPDEGSELSMGDSSIEITDDMIEKSEEKRCEAVTAISDGKFEDAVHCFTEAIKLNPGSALLHAKRANVLLHLNKPNAAIRDCDKALSLNADSAQAYKYRGRANRLLGNWEQAYLDLATACKIDYHDEANNWLKEVEPNYKKIFEHKRKHERKMEEKADRQRQQRRQKAQENYEKNKHAKKPEGCCGEDEDCGGMGGGLPDFLNDPDIMTAFQDPEVMQAFADVSQNPLNIGKYQNNPKVSKVLEKLAKKMGGGMGGGPTGMPGAFFKPPGASGSSGPTGPTCTNSEVQ